MLRINSAFTTDIRKQMDYEKQASEFLEKTGTKLTFKFAGYRKHFPDDKEKRLCYEFTLSRNGRSYTSTFGESQNFAAIALLGKILSRPYTIAEMGHLNASIATIKEDGTFMRFPVTGPDSWQGRKPKLKLPSPSAYTLLACLQKYDPGSLENFCSDFGYALDSKKAEAAYQAVKNEYLHMAALFSAEEMEQLAEIS